MSKTSKPKVTKPKRGPSPNKRSVDLCEERGWIAQVVESRIPHTFITKDLFGVIDIIAVVPPHEHRGYEHRVGGSIVGIQATGGTNHATRRGKILAEPRARQWLEAGGKLFVWTWNAKAIDGKEVWTVREEEITLAMFEAHHASQA